MSTRDRELLKEAHLPQKAVADLFGISLQAVNRGISCEPHYLNADRLGKLIDLVQPFKPDVAEILRQGLHRIVVAGDVPGEGRKTTSYVQLTSLADLLERENNGLIWVPIDPVTRLIEESEVLTAFLYKEGSKRITILTSVQAEEIRYILDERVYRLDFKTWLVGEIVVIQCDNLGLAPEMLLGEKTVFVRTVFGFQEVRESNAHVLLGRLLKGSKISPDFLPVKLSEGCRVMLSYSVSPYQRALDYLTEYFEEAGNQELAQWLTKFKDFPDANTKVAVPPLVHLQQILSERVLEQFGMGQQIQIFSALNFMLLNAVRENEPGN